MGFLLSNYQLTICILYSLIFCLSSSAAHLCHNDESTALLQFKQLFPFNCSVSVNCYDFSPPITDNWKEGTDCCAWDGVTCDDSTAHVIVLDLNCNCLYGTIHPNSSLFNLVHLQHLDLSYNNFNHSQILPSFGRFTNLTHLYLSDSSLSGPIQSSSEEVWQGNNFSNSIFHLQKLQELWLDGNRELTGKLPSFINGTLRHLRSLDLSETGFTGELPNSIGQLQYLEELLLSDCNLFGTIPTSLGNLKKLRMLDLGGNNFINGQFPSSIGHLKNLEKLYLRDCNFSELNLLCNLHSLRHLDLSNNQFGGLIPTCLGNFSGYLTVLNLRSNNFSGTIPQTFGYASKLLELDISNNGLQGVLPRSLANCTNLEILNLGHNFIEDAFPFWLENLPQLKIIVLRDNKFQGPIEQPRKRLAFTNLHIIDMSHNEFTGTLPSKFFESMHSMMMDDEDKSSSYYMHNGYGYYSVTIMNKGLEMKLVRIITIFNAVDFSHNKFDGNIPISIGRLKALCVLNFSSNGLTGLIPVSLGDLSELESLDLSQNKLSGKIPQQLTKLTFLEVLNFSQNNLTGLIPRGGQFETFSNTSYEGNLGLCGFPLSKNCGNVQIAESPTLPSSFSHNFKFKFDGFGWEAVLMGYGCGVLLGLLIGSCIIRRKEEWLVRIFGVKMCQNGKRSKRQQCKEKLYRNSVTVSSFANASIGL
ncbi:hypothetical protein ACSBR2_020253 [Camellia fascicularis]